MHPKVIALTSITILALLGGGILLVSRGQQPVITGLDDFAKCLADKGAVMYGAAWCSHCQKEKKAFGESFKYITYVECPLDPKKCLEADIPGYPTWIFGDGTRLEGEQGITNLSEASGCALP